MLEAVISHDAQAFRAFVASVLHTSSALLAHGDAANRPFRQSSARWRVLLCAAGGENSVPLIARSTGYSRQATQRLADALVADGLARYRPDEDDRRRQHFDLTDAGQAALDRLEAHFDVWGSRLATEIGPGELQRITDSLDRVHAIVQHDTPGQATSTT